LDDVPSCEGAPENDSVPGVWYKVTGAGKSMTASTCQSSMDTQSSVYVFSGTCGALECIDSTVLTCGLHASVTWEASAGVDYLFFVQASVDDELNPDGSFVLTIEETTSNNLCRNAIGPLLVDGSPTFGSTRSATNEALSSGRGIWYKVIGSGREITATTKGYAPTCSLFTNFETLLEVFNGECDGLESVKSIDIGNDCDNLGSLVQWVSIADEDYYILVSGTDASEYGNFALSILDSPNKI
jgi:hypothetical protein